MVKYLSWQKIGLTNNHVAGLLLLLIQKFAFKIHHVSIFWSVNNAIADLHVYCKVKYMSHLMTKPTMWLCAQWRLRSAWASASLIRVFAVRMKKAWVLSYPLSAQRRLWSDWADAQADLSLPWAHTHFVGFVMSRLIWGFICIRWNRIGFSIIIICGTSSEFVSSSIPSWQILTAHAQPFRGARDLAFCLKVPLDSLLVWASSGGSGETAWMHRLAWTFAARIGDKYQIRLTRPILGIDTNTESCVISRHTVP